MTNTPTPFEPHESGAYLHGTKADLSAGELLVPGRPMNYDRTRTANHVYLTLTLDAAVWGAESLVSLSSIALSSALLKKSVRGGLVVVGEVTLGGTIEPVHNAVSLAEIAVEKGAKALLLPVSCRRQLFDLSDEMATKLDIEFYQDGRDALLKALAE